MNNSLRSSFKVLRRTNAQQQETFSTKPLQRRLLELLEARGVLKTYASKNKGDPEIIYRLRDTLKNGMVVKGVAPWTATNSSTSVSLGSTN